MYLQKVTWTVLSTLFLQGTLFATEHAMTTSDIRSFPLTTGKVAIRGSYNRINDDIDIFDIKQKELGSTAKFGTIGDSTGLDLSLAYGYNTFYSFYYNYERLNLHYIDSVLHNNKNDIYVKVNIYQNPTAFFETLSADIGFVRNSADNLDIKDPVQLNKMIQKVNPIDGLIIGNDGFFYYKGIALKHQDSTSPTYPYPYIKPFVRIGDMSDNSLYLRLLTGMHYKTHIFDLYSGLKYTRINTTISIQPFNKDMSYYETLVNNGYAPVNLDRNEKTFFLGFNYTVEFWRFIFDLNYEYLTIWGRNDAIKATQDNHIFNSALSYIVNENLLVFIGGKLMLHQFNGVIPYLYNQYTKNKYDKKYGYAKIGFVYNFDTSRLFGGAAADDSYGNSYSTGGTIPSCYTCP